MTDQPAAQVAPDEGYPGIAHDFEEMRYERDRLRSINAELVGALEAMLAVYAELHARYDLGDCEATVSARTVLAKESA